jgi:hypothetical protein
MEAIATKHTKTLHFGIESRIQFNATSMDIFDILFYSSITFKKKGKPMKIV